MRVTIALKVMAVKLLLGIRSAANGKRGALEREILRLAALAQDDYPHRIVS
jgi:hypothetical protein